MIAKNTFKHKSHLYDKLKYKSFPYIKIPRMKNCKTDPNFET